MMKLSRLSERVLGIATLWNPIAAIGLVAGLALWPFILPAGESLQYPKDQLVYFALGALVMAILGVITIASLLSTTIFYAIHVVRNEKLSKGQKIRWSVLNVTLGLVAMPLYWHRHVFRSTATGEPGSN